MEVSTHHGWNRVEVVPNWERLGSWLPHGDGWIYQVSHNPNPVTLSMTAVDNEASIYTAKTCHQGYSQGIWHAVVDMLSAYHVQTLDTCIFNI